MNSIDLLSVRWIPKSAPYSDTIVVSLGDLVILEGVDGVFMIAEREDLKYCCSGCDVAVGATCNNIHFRCSGVKILKRVTVD